MAKATDAVIVVETRVQRPSGELNARLAALPNRPSSRKISDRLVSTLPSKAPNPVFRAGSESPPGRPFNNAPVWQENSRCGSFVPNTVKAVTATRPLIFSGAHPRSATPFFGLTPPKEGSPDHFPLESMPFKPAPGRELGVLVNFLPDRSRLWQEKNHETLQISVAIHSPIQSVETIVLIYSAGCARAAGRLRRWLRFSHHI